MRPLSTLLLHCLLIPLAFGGCTTMKDLAPAFEANKSNVDDLTTNVASIALQIRPLAVSVWDSEIESRRTSVILELQKLGIPHKNSMDTFSGAQIEADLANASMSWKADYERLGVAMAASASDPAERDRLEGLHPVLAAIQSLKLSPEEVAAHVKLLYESRGRIRTIRETLTKDYPYVNRAVVAKEQSLKTLDDFSHAIAQQARLAKTHADLFEFASKSNIDVAKAFGAVLSDEGLQGQVLGLVKDDRWKSSASDALKILNDLLATSTAEKVASTQ